VSIVHPSIAPAAEASRENGFVRRQLSDLGYLLPSMPIAIVGFSILVTLVATGLGTVITFAGIFLLFAALIGARWLGGLELARLRLAGRRELMAPVPTGEARAAGMTAALKRVLGGRQYWLSLLHAVLINPVVSLFSWSVTVAWLGVGLYGAGYWMWSSFADVDSPPSEVLADWIPQQLAASMPAATLDSLLWAAAGVFCLATLPLVTRGLVALHALTARGTVARALVQRPTSA